MTVALARIAIILFLKHASARFSGLKEIVKVYLIVIARSPVNFNEDENRSIVQTDVSCFSIDSIKQSLSLTVNVNNRQCINNCKHSSRPAGVNRQRTC